MQAVFFEEAKEMTFSIQFFLLAYQKTKKSVIISPKKKMDCNVFVFSDLAEHVV